MGKLLPSCFVIGTQKGGTSSLHSWLSMQRRLSMPRFKETHFFSEEDRYNRGWDWYINNFENRKEGNIMVEVDPDYLSSDIAMKRIYNSFSGSDEIPKFICILRDRIERAKSQWVMSKRRGLEERSFSEALVASFEKPNDCTGHNDYFSRGLYGRHIGKYKSIFEESEFLILGFEDLFLSGNSHALFEEILNFIGVEDELQIPDYEKRVNPSGVARSKSIANFLTNEKSFIRRVSRVIIPKEKLRIAIGRWLERVNNKPKENDIDYTEIDPRIIDAYKEDTAKFLDLFPESKGLFHMD